MCSLHYGLFSFLVFSDFVAASGKSWGMKITGNQCPIRFMGVFL